MHPALLAEGSSAYNPMWCMAMLATSAASFPCSFWASRLIPYALCNSPTILVSNSLQYWQQLTLATPACTPQHPCLHPPGHPPAGYNSWKGTVTSAEQLWDLIEGLRANGLLSYTHLITGSLHLPPNENPAIFARPTHAHRQRLAARVPP